MKFKEIRTAVIGVGSMGQNHARIYNDLSNLVAVVDPDEKLGKEVAKKYSTTYFSNYEDILDKVDAVSIAVPTTMHREVAESFASSGVNILVEKPLAQSVKEAQKIVDLASKNGIILAVGHIERHNEVIKYAKEKIIDGSWGQIYSISARRFSSFPDRIRDVGVVFDLTIHDVDILSYLIDSSVTSVSAIGGNFHNKIHEDHVILSLEYSNGVLGLCETNWSTPTKVRDISITTDKFFIQIDYINQAVTTFNTDYTNVDKSNLYQPKVQVKENYISLDKVEPLKSEIEDFLEAVQNHSNPLVTGLQGLKAVQIVEKTLESLQKGKKINLK